LMKPDQADLSSVVDLILLDIVMPDMDGVELCRQIKATEPLRDILVIMVTVQTGADDLDRAFGAGAMDYITKPLNKMELLARVRSALALKREMDIRKARERELDKRTKELEQLLSEVKVLRGFIPICAACKKIRNDQGYWEQVERYLRDRSEAEFTHDICPDCVEKLYPGLSHQ
ncbi:MAG: response regulator, partial [Nitrospirales bacterium]